MPKKRPTKVSFANSEERIKQIQGHTFIGFERRKEKDSCCEGSEEAVLHFSDGSEISIYMLRGVIQVEGD